MAAWASKVQEFARDFSLKTEKMQRGLTLKLSSEL